MKGVLIMTTMTREQAIRNYVEQLNGDDLTHLLQHMNEYDDCFEETAYYDMEEEEFDEFLSGRTPMEIARMVFFGKFNPNKDYFRFNACGNLESADWPDIVAEAEDLESDIIDHLVHYYSGGTPWPDLDALVHADEDTLFNEYYKEVDEDDEQ
nr:MAG: hypothetical protein [Bacteriophage sp.]